jgi:hypothetical protein
MTGLTARGRSPPARALNDRNQQRSREDATLAPTEHDTQAGEDTGNDILVTLNGINKGRLVGEASEKLSELVSSVKRYEKKGTLTIKIEIAPGTVPDSVTVKAGVDAKAPQPEHPGFFYVDDSDRLTRDDPSMDPMFTRNEIAGGGNR